VTETHKSPLGKTRHRLEANIKMDLQEVGYESMEWIDVAQDRGRWRTLVNAAMNLRVHCVANRFSASQEILRI